MTSARCSLLLAFTPRRFTCSPINYLSPALAVHSHICHPDTPKKGTTTEAIWKYNFPNHIQRCHPSHWDEALQEIIQDPEHKSLWQAIRVSQQEKDAIVAWAQRQSAKCVIESDDDNAKPKHKQCAVSAGQSSVQP